MSQITDLSPCYQYFFVIEKVTEKVVHEQTSKFLNDNNVFYQTYFYHVSIIKC